MRRGDDDDDVVVKVVEAPPTYSSRAVVLEVSSVAARLPGNCDDVARGLRDLVTARVSAASTVPFARWDLDAVDLRSAPARARASYGAFCAGPRGFEPAAFGMRLAEAAALDPQQRLFLETSYDALLAAGYQRRKDDTLVDATLPATFPNRATLAPRFLAGANVAVCLGMMNMDAALSLKPEDVGPHDLTGNGYASAGSRLSFLFDMHGPCTVVDTACSASLVAAHAAARFLEAEEADAALFAGTSLMLAPSFVHVGAAVAAMTSETGRCHTFDAAADGYCRGEGCGVVMLGIRRPDMTSLKGGVAATGFAVKHNGQSATFTALNSISQTRLMEACKGARLTLAVEAHGTGTKLGDPIEIAGLANFKKATTAPRTILNAVKANLGHTEPTAGAAGYLASLIVAVANEPQPNAALRTANPVARIEKLDCLAPPTDTVVAGATSSPRAFSVGVSSFGYSGIIAHAVLKAVACIDDDDNDLSPTLDVRDGRFILGDEASVKEDLVVRRRRSPGEVLEARALSKRLMTKQRGVLDARHPWLQHRPSADGVVVFDIKRMSAGGCDDPSNSSCLLEIALASAHATGVNVLVDVSITASPTSSKGRRKVPTRSVIDDDELRLENSDGEAVLVATLASSYEPLRGMRRCVTKGRPPVVSSIYVCEELGAAWRLGKNEARGLVVKRTGSTLRASSLEAARRLTGVFLSRDVEWVHVDEVRQLADDGDSTRAWARVARIGDSSKNDDAIVVDCDVMVSNRTLALRGASARCHKVPAVVDEVAVYEVGLAWKKFETASRRGDLVTILMRVAQSLNKQHGIAQPVKLLDSDLARVSRDSHVLIVAGDDEQVGHAWSSALSLLPVLSRERSLLLPRYLRQAGFRQVDIVSSSPPMRMLEPQLVVADANAYTQLRTSDQLLHTFTTVEVTAGHLLPLAARWFGGAVDALLVNAARISTHAATEMCKLRTKPFILVGNGDIPMAPFYADKSEELRIVLCGERKIQDPSRISTTVLAGASPHLTGFAQRCRLDGSLAVAQVGPLSSLKRGGLVSTCVRGATMIAWAAAVLTPSIEIRYFLLPAGSAPTTSPATATSLSSSRRRRREQKGKKKSVRSIVAEVVTRLVGPEAISTSFADIGIDSLQGTEIARELSERLGREVPPTLLLEAQGIEDLATLLGADETNGAAVVEMDEVVTDQPTPQAETSLEVGVVHGDSVPSVEAQSASMLLPETVKCAQSTPDQELLFWMTKRQNRFAWLPVTAIGELVGDVDIAALERSVHAVVMRHEALRSRLVRVGLGDNDSTLFVVDDDKRRFPQLEVREACSAGEARNEVQTFHNEYDNDAFAPLLPVRALLVCYPREVAHHNGVRATNALLYVSTNHAVSDGWSQQLLYNDLVAAYNNDGVFPKDRPKPARRYCEFLAWHNDQVARLADDPKVQAHIRQYAAATRLPSRWPTVCGTDKVVDTLFETGSLLHTDEVAIISAASVAAVKARLRGDVADFGRASLPSVLLAAYVTALGDAQLGRSVVLQYSHTGRIGQPDLAETYGQLATDMNVIVPASAEPEQQQLGAFISRVHNAVVNSLSLGSVVPYSLAYRASDGRHPLPPQFNWYDRYSDIPRWRGLEATEIAIDQTQMRTRTFNLGAIYLMCLVQSDGCLMLKIFFNEHVYARETIQLALERIKSFLDLLSSQTPATPIFAWG